MFGNTSYLEELRFPLPINTVKTSTYSDVSEELESVSSDFISDDVESIWFLQPVSKNNAIVKQIKNFFMFDNSFVANAIEPARCLPCRESLLPPHTLRPPPERAPPLPAAKGIKPWQKFFSFDLISPFSGSFDYDSAVLFSSTEIAFPVSS
jgi:hypothetical protein